jgi:acyl carrier protein
MTVPTGKTATFEAVTREIMVCDDVVNRMSVTVEAVTQEIIELIRAELGAVELTADSNLLNQGLDSVKLMSLLFMVEDRYDIRVEDEDGDDLRTVGDLAALVVRRIQERP